MNILFVNNQYQLGGAETVVHQLRDGLTARGHHTGLTVALGKVYLPGVIPLYPKVLSRLSHTRFHRIVERAFPRFRWTDSAFQRLPSKGFDLIHLHNFHGNYASIASLSKVANNAKVLWTFHAFWGVTGGCDHPKDCQRFREKCGDCPQVGQWPVGDTDRTAAQLQEKLERLSCASLDIVAPAEWMAKIIRSSPVGRNWKTHVIPNGVNPSEFCPDSIRRVAARAKLGIGKGEISILVVNRDYRDSQKGFPMVQEALMAAPSKGACVILAGGSSDWAASQIDNIRSISTGYVVSRVQMADLYLAADIFLFASPAETFPCVILEAMSAECCVTATPTGGVVEQIVNGESGILAEKISGEALGKALQTALCDEQLRRRTAHGGRTRVQKYFTEETMIDSYFALYQKILLG